MVGHNFTNGSHHTRCDPKDLSIMSEAKGINFVLPVYASFFGSRVPAAIDLHFMYHQSPGFQLKFFFIVLLKKKSPMY